MKLRFLTLLAAAALAAAPAAAQTVKALGYNTTNGFIVYSGTNPLTFTNALQFETNARAATRTNLGGTLVGDAVFTATNAAAGATALGLGTTNDVTFNNLTTTGTLTATGNVTMNGVANTAPSQTADSGSSLMTRDLADTRYGQALRASVVGATLTTNNTTLEDIPGLSLALPVGMHQITTQVFIVADAAAGSKMAMAFDGTGSPSGQRQTITTSVVQAVAVGSFASVSSATTAEVLHFRVYTIEATVAGTLKVQAAQNVAGSNNISATGFLRAERL